MLSKVLKIQGIGTFRDLEDAAKNPFRKATFIYGQNGKGKSTLASILRACSQSNAETIINRKTINWPNEQAASFVFGNSKTEFMQLAWRGAAPNIVVYDNRFIEENVYLSNEVTPGQRARLFNFALGSKAVRAKERERESTAAAQAAREECTQLERQILYITKGKMGCEEFDALVEDPLTESEIKARILWLERQLEDVNRVAVIRKIPLPDILPLPELDVDGVLKVLRETLTSVHARAQVLVDEHARELRSSEVIPWLSKGVEMMREECCPFCAQDTSNVELVKLYQIYFDSAYAELAQRALDAFNMVDGATSAPTMRALEEVDSQNLHRFELWNDFLPNKVAYCVSIRELSEKFRKFRSKLLPLLDSKRSDVFLDVLSDSQEMEIRVLWREVVSTVKTVNAAVQARRCQIDEYVTSLAHTASEDLEMELEIAKLRAERLRPEIERLMKDWNAARAARQQAEDNKFDAREALNAEMGANLEAFSRSINEVLRDLGARFSIEKFSHNYLGSTPRVQYAIMLRKEEIPLKGESNSFSTALSEGDKKTMAFAFFVASLRCDSELRDKIVVIDDPMSSLDTHRRRQTIRIIADLVSKCEQVILMAHDAYFLRDTRVDVLKELRGDETLLTVLELVDRGEKGSQIAPCDIEELCKSQYRIDYERVTKLVKGEISETINVYAEAPRLRRLLEGYLHQKYPTSIPDSETLGKVIARLNNADAETDVFWPMRAKTKLLRELNDDVSGFHHNTRPGLGDSALSVDELVACARKILEFIHAA